MKNAVPGPENLAAHPVSHHLDRRSQPFKVVAIAQGRVHKCVAYSHAQHTSPYEGQAARSVQADGVSRPLEHTWVWHAAQARRSHYQARLAHRPLEGLHGSQLHEDHHSKS